MHCSSSPIFIIGVARSGTTLLSLMLDSHSRIAIPFESHFFVSYYRQYNTRSLGGTDEARKIAQQILSEPYLRRWDLSVYPDELDLRNCPNLPAVIAEIYRVYAKKCGKDKDIWGDKSPPYTQSVYILEKMFPTARYIHLIRDGRDVALSLMNKLWGPGDFVSSIEYWVRNISCARRMLYMLPEDRYIEVRFEQLVADPESEIKRVVDFLGVEFEPAMIHAYTDKASKKVGWEIDNIHSHLKEAPSTSQAFKWKHQLNSADQALAYEIAGKELEELGYESGVTHARLNTIRKCYHLLKGGTKRKVRNMMRYFRSLPTENGN
jgi:hypothetical protein